ncbi:hypothetical protein [Dactylosporangium sp. CA-092794]|uniref:hypothetical protein n=1 Tax=Dactylosporangium sp. CA-092794 TaxID=3239929 RepID=UPI003D944A51
MTIDQGAVDAPATITITWTCTETYRDHLNLASVAGAARHSVAAVTADPSLLHGRVGDQLADRLTAFQDDTRIVDEPEVEIITTDLADQPSLTELVKAARRIVAAESITGRGTAAGQALAGLLAGLRREQRID